MGRIVQTKEIQVERFSSHLPAATVSSLVGILMLTNGVLMALSTWVGGLLPTIFYSVKLANDPTENLTIKLQ